MNETELEVSSDSATNQQRLEVLQQQEELIEDEQEQEAKESEARKVKKDLEDAAKAEELSRKEAEEKELADEKQKAIDMLPTAEVRLSSFLPSVPGLTSGVTDHAGNDRRGSCCADNHGSRRRTNDL